MVFVLCVSGIKFEAQEIRELKMILDGQNEIHRALKALVSKLDEVVGRQERELSMLTLLSQQSQSGTHQPSGHQVSFVIALLLCLGLDNVSV